MERLSELLKKTLEEELGTECILEIDDRNNSMRVKLTELIPIGPSYIDISSNTMVEPEYLIDQILYKAIKYKVEWVRDNMGEAKKYVRWEDKENDAYELMRRKYMQNMYEELKDRLTMGIGWEFK